MTDVSKKRERFCPVCACSMGQMEDRNFDKRDTCGARECEREMRDADEAERQEAHEQLDRDRGWNY